MFKQAVQKHDATAAATVPAASNNPAYKQPSLASALSRTGPTQRPYTRPSTFGVDNIAKKSVAGGDRSPVHGTKRTSSGLAKSWSSHEETFDYPTLNISELEKENDFPAYRPVARSTSGGLATALFDEDDFDSDVDLDLEDPATKGTIAYPKLPPVSPSATKDSGYSSRPQSVQPKIELDSSQPIPWSSSPVEHFKTPPKAQSIKTKRRALPWSQQQSQPKQQLTEEVEGHMMANKKHKSASVTTNNTFTPLPKDSSKSQYPWNTTASAFKLQQQALKEQHKAKVAENTDDTDNTKRKKKTVIAKMFLSDEQKNVLDLVIQHKKSVFFTGSAGKSSCQPYKRHN
jgi:ATP-dependent DNA helicase PIF1